MPRGGSGVPPGWSPARSAATSRYVPRRWGWIWNRAAWTFSPKRSFLTPPPVIFYALSDAELSKLQLLAGGKPLTQEQARSVSPTTEFNVFAFLRQLQAGQTASVWKSILEEQAKGEEPLFYLLAMLQREARQLWQILAGEQVRMGPSDQQAKQQTASRLGAAGLAKLWDAMHTAELSVKSGRRSPSQALDALMGDLTLLFTPAQRRSPR